MKMIGKSISRSKNLPHLLTLILLGSFLSPIPFTEPVMATGEKAVSLPNIALSSLAQIKGLEGPGADSFGQGLGPRNDPPAASPGLKGNPFPSIPGVLHVFDRNFGKISSLNNGPQPSSSKSKATEYLAKRPLSFI